MKKIYITAMCSDKEPGQEPYKKAYKLADVPADRKKHIRFQVVHEFISTVL
jgi:hypothetical protein